MYVSGSSAARGFGIIPAIAVSGGISLLSSLFGSHSGKTTHAQRFLQAQTAGDTALAHLLIDQAYSHAYLENISDKADWQQVWSVMLAEANPANHTYMNQKMGVVSGSGGVTGSPNQPGAGVTTADMGKLLLSPVGIGLALGIGYLALSRR